MSAPKCRCSEAPSSSITTPHASRHQIFRQSLGSATILLLTPSILPILASFPSVTSHWSGQLPYCTRRYCRRQNTGTLSFLYCFLSSPAPSTTPPLRLERQSSVFLTNLQQSPLSRCFSQQYPKYYPSHRSLIVFGTHFSPSSSKTLLTQELSCNFRLKRRRKKHTWCRVQDSRADIFWEWELLPGDLT